MSLFVTFEGGEGCGKSTQTRALRNRLEKLAIPAIFIREPGGTPLGERIRHILKKSTEIQIAALTELILFNASRSQLVSQVIRPALNSGNIVVCDRFADSTVAYQCYGRGLDRQKVNEMNEIAVQGLKPDLTFLLDVSPTAGLARKQPDANDRFEKEQLAFHQRIRAGFLEMAAAEPQRWKVIDSTLPRQTISARVWEEISRRLTSEGAKLPT
jgi:dTMP kinase